MTRIVKLKIFYVYVRITNKLFAIYNFLKSDVLCYFFKDDRPSQTAN